MYRKAARVLPLPVGAWMSVCSPRAIAAQPSAWACVGASKLASNHSRTAGEKGASGSATTVVAMGLVSIGCEVAFDQTFYSEPVRHGPIGRATSVPTGGGAAVPLSSERWVSPVDL